MQARFGEARVARLATVGPDGAPHLVPVCFTLHQGEILSVVDAKPKGTTALARLRNIARDPRVTLIVDHYDDDDWNHLWWVRVEGEARVIEGGAEHTSAVSRLRSKYPQYVRKRPTGPVIAVSPTRWRGWSASP